MRCSISWTGRSWPEPKSSQTLNQQSHLGAPPLFYYCKNLYALANLVGTQVFGKQLGQSERWDLMMSPLTLRDICVSPLGFRIKAWLIHLCPGHPEPMRGLWGTITKSCTLTKASIARVWCTEENDLVYPMSLISESWILRITLFRKYTTTFWEKKSSTGLL